MAYTPELSQRHSGTLRRVAWALGKPMTRTLEDIIEWVGEKANPQTICPECRDKTVCEECIFHRKQQ